MAILGSKVDSEFIKVDTFTGDGGVTYGPLSVDVQSPAQIGVHNNGYYQAPTTDYIVTGNQITFNVAPAVSNTIVVLHLGLGTIATGIELSDNTVTTSTLSNTSLTGDKIASYTIDAGVSIDGNSVLFLGNNISTNTISGSSILSNFYSNSSIESSNTFNVYTFNGTSSGIGIYNTTNYVFGSGDFTIEFWMNASSIGQTTYATIMDGTTNGSGTTIALNTNIGNNPLLRGRIHFDAQRGSTPNMVSSTVVTDNTWHHVACVKSGSNGYLFIDGVLENTTTSWASVTGATLSDGRIGRSRYGSSGLAGDNTYTGKLAQIRILKGTALYTSNFAPPLTGVTKIANTQLLIVTNTVIDTSNNIYPLTGMTSLPSVSTETFTLYANTSTFIVPPAHLTGNLIADTSLRGNNIVADTITGNLIADNSIRGNNIIAGTITGNLIADTSIRGNQIAISTITGNLFAANAIIGGIIGQTAVSANVVNTTSIQTYMTTAFPGDGYVVANAVTYTLAGDYVFNIPANTTRLKITAVGSGGGSGGVCTASEDPLNPAQVSPFNQVSISGESGQGGGGAGFIAYIKGPFPSNTFNIRVGSGGNGGLVNFAANTVNNGNSGNSTMIWSLRTVNSNISITANGGAGSNGYNAMGYGRPTNATNFFQQPYPTYGRGAKGGVAGAANVANSDYVILHYAGFDGNTAADFTTIFPDPATPTANYRAYWTTRDPVAGVFVPADYNPMSAKTILGGYGRGGDMVTAARRGFYRRTGQSEPGWQPGLPGANGAIIIEY